MTQTLHSTHSQHASSRSATSLGHSLFFLPFLQLWIGQVAASIGDRTKGASFMDMQPTCATCQSISSLLQHFIQTAERNSVAGAILLMFLIILQ